ncbi:MAG: RNA 2',3'-cyclic phosphodiesterase [Acidobacteriota bacterium]
MIRLFVAVDLPESVREVLRGGLGRLRRDQPSARWVRAEAMHITLKFLGEQGEDVVEALDVRMREAVPALAPVAVRLGGAGFFPNPRRPRVAWVGGQAEGLTAWAETVERCAGAVGVAPETRPFSLHLTLARLERPWGVQATEHFVVQVDKRSFPEFEAREIVLFRSELRPSGAQYTALRRWRVGS